MTVSVRYIRPPEREAFFVRENCKEIVSRVRSEKEYNRIIIMKNNVF